MIFYSVHHVTRFEYDSPVRESVMEVRMRPKDESYQSCMLFDLAVFPKSLVRHYRDHQGNIIHHFDIPQTHLRETIIANSVVKIAGSEQVPDRMGPEAWDALERLLDSPDYWEFIQNSTFARRSRALDAYSREIEAEKRDDPLTTVRHIVTAMRKTLDYRLESTNVNSPIEEALEKRAGVCQDFAHILIALCRRLRIPARYVSGYLARGNDVNATNTAQAGHAWAEVLLPGVSGGWIGFDPTNDTVVTDGHIRVAVGRDYADVPPTRGVYRGGSDSKIKVAVAVTRLEREPTLRRHADLPNWTSIEPPEPVIVSDDPATPFDIRAQQLQQQQ